MMKHDFGKQLPQYQCHKIVGALTIKSLKINTSSRFTRQWTIEFVEEGFSPMTVTDEWANAHHLREGGMIVQYANNYISFSPKVDFDGGYTALGLNTAADQSDFVRENGAPN